MDQLLSWLTPCQRNTFTLTSPLPVDIPAGSIVRWRCWTSCSESPRADECEMGAMTAVFTRIRLLHRGAMCGLRLLQVLCDTTSTSTSTSTGTTTTTTGTTGTTTTTTGTTGTTTTTTEPLGPAPLPQRLVRARHQRLVRAQRQRLVRAQRQRLVRPRPRRLVRAHGNDWYDRATTTGTSTTTTTAPVTSSTTSTTGVSTSTTDDDDDYCYYCADFLYFQPKH